MMHYHITERLGGLLFADGRGLRIGDQVKVDGVYRVLGGNSEYLALEDVAGRVVGRPMNHDVIPLDGWRRADQVGGEQRRHGDIDLKDSLAPLLRVLDDGECFLSELPSWPAFEAELQLEARRLCDELWPPRATEAVSNCG